MKVRNRPHTSMWGRFSHLYKLNGNYPPTLHALLDGRD